MYHRRVVVLVLAILVTTTVPWLAQAWTWRVEKDGSGDYSVIQDAINVAAAGDTIRIGPGRFEEYQTYTYPAGDYDVCLFNTLPALTIVGCGVAQTTVYVSGTGSSDYSAGVFSDYDVAGDGLWVSDVTFEGGFFGALSLNGRLRIVDCLFVNVSEGVVLFTGGHLSNCRFDQIAGTGITGISPGQSIVIEECAFESCDSYGFYFQNAPNVSVSGCEIIQCTGGGFYDASSGSVTDCTFNIAYLGTGLGVYGSGEVLLANCVISGANRNLYLLHASGLTVEHNVLSPALVESIWLLGGKPTFHNNHILPGGGYSVLLDGFPSIADNVYIDMRNNYWGTAESDSISAWIYDGHDEADDPIMGMKAFVEYEPFSAVPLDKEKKSMGGFKAMFRDATR